MVQKRRKTKKQRRAEIRDYDTRDTSTMIEPDKPLAFGELDPLSYETTCERVTNVARA